MIAFHCQEKGGNFGEVYVSPLTIASYLGDYKAADIFIQKASKKWKKVVLVLAKSSRGDDSSGRHYQITYYMMKLWHMKYGTSRGKHKKELEEERS